MQIGNYTFDQEAAMALLQQVGSALLILIVTWLLAKIIKWIFAKLVDSIPFFQKASGSGQSVGQSLGKIVSLFVWLFGLLAILNVFNLDGVMAPLQAMLNTAMGYVPNIFGAGLILFIGLIVARIVRDILVTALETANVDKWASKGGVDEVTDSHAISNTLGTIVYALIVILVSISALDVLDIQVITQPAKQMLNMIFEAIPLLIGAAILLGIGYMISKFVMKIIEEALPGLGFDKAVASMGLLPEGTSASNIVGRIVQIAILLFSAIAATQMLNFEELTNILNAVLELGGSVIFGAVVILVGFLIANMLARFMGGMEGVSGGAANIVRYATMILFTFMGLQFMGVGENIVEMAFGALVIGGAVAGALAFGLGGREWAGKKLEEMDKNKK